MTAMAFRSECEVRVLDVADVRASVESDSLPVLQRIIDMASDTAVVVASLLVLSVLVG